MRRLLQTAFCIVSLLSCVACFAQNAVALRVQGVGYAARGDYASAAPHLAQAAELGYYVAQIEYAVLLDTSPPPVNDNIKAFAWYSLVIARNGTDTDFAEERRALVAQRLDAEATQQASQLASELVAKYGQPAE